MTEILVAHVALPLPVADPYRYLVPAALADRALPGARVVVPVRQREMLGIVTGLDQGPAPDRARELLAAPDDEPAVKRAGGIEALIADPESIPQVHIRADVNTPWRCVAGAIYNIQAAGYPTVGFISNPVDPNG